MALQPKEIFQELSEYVLLFRSFGMILLTEHPCGSMVSQLEKAL